MRIIAGDFRGKRLFAPNDYKVRPTSDKIKESIFNIIAPFLPDSIVIDGFSGSGSLGLEALSRGAHRVYFVDNSQQSVALIRKNILHCHMEEKSEIIVGRFEQAVIRIPIKADLILLDPPYGRELLEKALQTVCDKQLLSDEGVVVAEHPKEQKLPNTFCSISKISPSLIKSKERRYGNICVSMYEKNIISGDI